MSEIIKIMMPDFNKSHHLDKITNRVAKTISDVVKKRDFTFVKRSKYLMNLRKIKKESIKFCSIGDKHRKLFFDAQNDDDIAELDITIENCECIDQVNVTFVYSESVDAPRMNGILYHSHSSVIYIICFLPIDMYDKEYSLLDKDFYFELVAALRHEIQHSYQMFFLNETGSIVHHAIQNLASHGIFTLLEREKLYMIGESEMEAFLKAWKLLAKKQHRNWKFVMFDAIDKRKKRIFKKLTQPSKEIDEILADEKVSWLKINQTYYDIEKRIIEFNKKFGHKSTYLS